LGPEDRTFRLLRSDKARERPYIREPQPGHVRYLKTAVLADVTESIAASISVLRGIGQAYTNAVENQKGDTAEPHGAWGREGRTGRHT